LIPQVSLYKRSLLKNSQDLIKKRMANLELFKYVLDIGKGLYDCEVSWAREDVFIWSGLLAGIITCHKQMIKSLKLPEGIQKNPSAEHGLSS